MSVVLFWILRILFLLFIIRLVLRVLGIGQMPQAPRQRVRRTEHAGGTLVQDPHCGTYLPQSRALALGSGGDTKYFCSPACRDAFLAANVQAPSPKPHASSVK
jgi:uncharacterized protein